MSDPARAAAEAVNRTDLQPEPAALLRRCAAAWPTLHAALTACGAGEPAWSPAQVRALFEGLCRWRGLRARADVACPVARRCHFLVGAALRLLLLDRFHELTPAARAALCADLGAWSSPLGAAELRKLCEFPPLSRAALTAEAEAAGSAWWAQAPPPRLWAQAAFAAVFTTDADDEQARGGPDAPEELLTMLERLDGAEAAREALEDAMARRCGADQPQCDGARVAAWAATKAGVPFSDDGRAAFVEALVRTRLNPVHDFADGREKPSAALARVQPERATQVSAACAPGVRLLGRADADAQDVGTLTIAVLDYYMDQRHGVAWAAQYYAHHFAARAALERLNRYLADRMVDPPPLVVRLPAAWYVAERERRPGAFARVLRFDTAAAAVEHWLRWVRTNRAGTVAAGRSVGRVLAEVLDDAPEQEQVQLRAAPVFN